MKIYSKSGLLLALISLIAVSCKKEKPEVPKENELITTLILTLTNSENPDDKVVLRFFDIDGMGGIPPEITKTGDLKANNLYNGSITLLDETQSPPGDVNKDIKATDRDHQFFYIVHDLDVKITYRDFDPNGLPLGLKIDMQTGEPSVGTLTIILKHYPDKTAPNVAQGDITNAGGSTDIEATFELEILP